MGGIPKKLQAHNMMFIPVYSTVNNEGGSSFTLKFDIFPEKIQQRFSNFEYSNFFNRFKFVSENGAEFEINCIRQPIPTLAEGQTYDEEDNKWRAWVNLIDSIHPEKDMERLIEWLGFAL